MPDVRARATTLAVLHESGELTVLPTVWDTWSARVAADAGFKGLTVGSHPVADAIGMHESTVSRVTSNKYIATPRGVFELKFFFTAAIQSSEGGEAHSAASVARESPCCGPTQAVRLTDRS